MDRRSFLKFAAAAPAVPLVPAWLEPLPQWGQSIASMMAPYNRALTEQYYVLMHPANWLDIRRMVARDLWRIEYSAWRKARRDGEQVETFGELAERVRDEADNHALTMTRATKTGEVGRYEGFRFIEQATVA